MNQLFKQPENSLLANDESGEDEYMAFEPENWKQQDDNRIAVPDFQNSLDFLESSSLEYGYEHP